jgi:hypothetical protein
VSFIFGDIGKSIGIYQPMLIRSGNASLNENALPSRSNAEIGTSNKGKSKKK